MDDIISDLNDLNGKLDQINEKEESLRMHPGDENSGLFWMREWHRQRQKETALQWEC